MLVYSLLPATADGKILVSYNIWYSIFLNCACSEECIANCDHRHNAVSLVESLPDLNKQVLYYLLRFLKVRVGLT